MNYRFYYNSPIGEITLLSDGTALTGLCFNGQAHFPSAAVSSAEKMDLPIFRDSFLWLDTYFSGRIPAFTPKLSVQGAEFQLRIWKLLQTIPYGKTMTYGELAALAAKEAGISRMSAQAVGGAVSRNPVSLIIPCHRIIGKNGSLVGYAGGIDRKQYLLELEQRALHTDR